MNNSLFVHQMWETSDAQPTAIKSVKHYKKSRTDRKTLKTRAQK